MKLKQRVIITGSMFLVMTTLFLIGVQLGSKPEGPEKAPKGEGGDTQRVKLPNIPGVADYMVDERVNNPLNQDRKAVVESLMARYNRSKGIPAFPRGPSLNDGKKPNLLRNLDAFDRQWEEAHRRLQQRTQPEERPDMFDKLPIGKDGLEQLAHKHLDELMQRDKHEFMVPPQLDTPLPQNGGKFPDENDEVVARNSRARERNPWNIWHSWVQQDQFYPEDAFFSEEMDSILHAMATYPIRSFDVGHRGTQLKATMFLGEQRTVFKPMRYSRSEVIGGDPYAGFDRHNAEIAGFHLDGILGFRIAPPVVGRRVNLTALWPVTSAALRETYFQDDDGNTCFYGKCYYCRRGEAACANGEIMEGSVTLWLSDWYELKTRRHPYQRTYRPNRKAKWEVDNTYCNTTVMNPRSDYYYGLLEFTDSSIYDFLMGNADRHHYETYAKAKRHGKLLHIDNGKSFGNPGHDEMSILAPLSQCCRVRESTWLKVQELLQADQSLSQQLDRSMRRDPVYPILTAAHLEAIDRRLHTIAGAVDDCIRQQGRDRVIVSKWPI